MFCENIFDKWESNTYVHLLKYFQANHKYMITNIYNQNTNPKVLISEFIPSSVSMYIHLINLH